jgi:hypothetical protein
MPTDAEPRSAIAKRFEKHWNPRKGGARRLEGLVLQKAIFRIETAGASALRLADDPLNPRDLRRRDTRKEGGNT